MKTLSPATLDDFFIPESNSTIRLVFVYADAPTRAIAMEVFNTLHQQLHSEFSFRAVSWSFEFLGQLKILDLATKAAVEADMIFCSTYRGQELPVSAEVWIDSWLPQKTDPESALVALLRGSNSGSVLPCPTELFLRQIAQAAKMDFFVKEFCADHVRPMAAAAALTDGSVHLHSFQNAFHGGPESTRRGINE